MRSRDFCYWLQGYFEIRKDGGKKPSLNAEQIACIQKHLSMVFAYEIDPSFGDANKKLDQIHNGRKPRAEDDDDDDDEDFPMRRVRQGVRVKC